MYRDNAPIWRRSPTNLSGLLSFDDIRYIETAGLLSLLKRPEDFRPSVRCAPRLVLTVVVGLTSLLLLGCQKQPRAKVVYGSVKYGAEKVQLGQVSFEPLGSTPGPNRTSMIVDGQYRIDAKGGIPFGKYRVRVDARKTTGRKVMGRVGPERAMIDEEVRVGPASYSSDRSPLVADVTAGFNGQFDIVLPPNPG